MTHTGVCFDTSQCATACIREDSPEGIMTTAENHIAVQSNNEQSISEPPEPDPLYLFACHLEWRIEAHVDLSGELRAALAHSTREVRLVAQSLISDKSPRPSNPDRNPGCANQ
jgi:hypothetical protein